MFRYNVAIVLLGLNVFRWHAHKRHVTRYRSFLAREHLSARFRFQPSLCMCGANITSLSGPFPTDHTSCVHHNESNHDVLLTCRLFCCTEFLLLHEARKGGGLGVNQLDSHFQSHPQNWTVHSCQSTGRQIQLPRENAKASDPNSPAFLSM